MLSEEYLQSLNKDSIARAVFSYMLTIDHDKKEGHQSIIDSDMRQMKRLCDRAKELDLVMSDEFLAEYTK